MIEIGRLCVKIAGRDAGLKGIIVDIVDDDYVLIDGQVRRKRCNVKHLELLDQVIKIKKGASHSDIVNELNKLGVEIKEKKAKEKKEKPKKIRKIKEKPTEEKAKPKKTIKKEIKEKVVEPAKEKPVKKKEEKVKKD